MPEFDPHEMLERYKERAEAVRKRNLPAVGGDERRLFIERAEIDYMDYAIIADATPTFENGVLTLTVDMRPPAQRDED